MADEKKEVPKHPELIEKLAALPNEERVEVIHSVLERDIRRSFLSLPPQEPPEGVSPMAGAPSQPHPESYLSQEDLAEGDAPPTQVPPELRALRREGKSPGIQYVARPLPTPVLRVLKQDLYDTLIVPEDGRVDSIDLFTDPKWFPDHTPKTEADCNMTMGGCLGMPLEYDLRYIDLVFEKVSHPSDLQRVLKGLVFKWIRGQVTPWMKLTLSGFDPFLRGQADGLSADKAEAALQEAAKNGMWSHYRVMVTTPDGEPQRISSTESFRVNVNGNLGELYGPVRLKVKLGDTLYAPI